MASFVGFLPGFSPFSHDSVPQIITNSSLIKSSNNAPGISDHDMVVTDCDTKPYFQSKRPRKCYIYSKENWDKLHEDCL
jgi:hypothetical protein